jgi:hypothetical protein
MGNCICVRERNMISSEIKINIKESYNSKPFQIIINSNELINYPSHNNSYSSNNSHKYKSNVTNYSNDNTMNSFSPLIQSNYNQIKEMSQRLSLFGISKSNTFSQEKKRINKTPKNNYENKIKYKLDLYEDDTIQKKLSKFRSSKNFHNHPIFSKLCEHSKKNKKLNLD